MVLSKFRKMFEIISVNGGVVGSIKKLFMQDALKEGRLVGQDQLGNRYYENNRYFIGRSRWVEYNSNVFLEFDASQVTPEWHGWLHYSTDMLPCEDPNKQFHSWLLNHQENMTSTRYAYIPYSTSRPKIQAWHPKKEGPHMLKS